MGQGWQLPGLRGGLRQVRRIAGTSTGLVPAGTVIRFEGPSPQTVQVEDYTSSFVRDAVVAAGADVWLDTTLRVAGRLTVEEGAILTQDNAHGVLLVDSALPVTSSGFHVETTRTNGPIVMATGATLPHGGSLEVVDRTSLDVGAQTLDVGGDLRITLILAAALPGAAVTFATDVTVRGVLQVPVGSTVTQAKEQTTTFTAALPETSEGYRIASAIVGETINLNKEVTLPNGGSLRFPWGRALKLNGHTLGVSGSLRG